MNLPDHISLKLSSGEVLISRVDSITEDSYFLEYPMIISYSQNAFNQVYLISLNPFNILQELFTLNKKHVMIELELNDEIIQYYEKVLDRKLSQYYYDDEEYSIPSVLYSFEVTANTSVN
jgi:hypothetical protein